MGRQHGEQVLDLRPQILEAIEARLKSLRRSGALAAGEIARVQSLWEQHAASTLELLRGMADSLALDWDDYFAYTISSYLAEHSRQLPIEKACTAWAAAAPVAREGEPILAKNRDYRPDHRELQCLALMQPTGGNLYLCLTSAASPGVFSSGINCAGLAVADNFVASTDTGPGIARYSLMMDILERFSRVDEAVAYLHTRPHFGDGNVILADAEGDLAVFEIAHTRQAVRRARGGWIASTNHFSAPETRERWMETSAPRACGNSQARRARVETALQVAQEMVDAAWAQRLMAKHGGLQNAICRHPSLERKSVTISTVIYLPRQRGLWVANGFPCQAPFEFFQVD